MSEKRVSGVARIAVQVYQKIARTERRLEELKKELGDLLFHLRDEDVEYYFIETSKIQKVEDSKLALFLRRRRRGRRS